MTGKVMTATIKTDDGRAHDVIIDADAFRETLQKASGTGMNWVGFNNSPEGTGSVLINLAKIVSIETAWGIDDLIGAPQ